MNRFVETSSKELVNLIAYIVKEPYGYELRIKKDNESDKFAHAGRYSCDEILKNSITATWERYEGDDEDVVWVAVGI